MTFKGAKGDFLFCPKKIGVIGALPENEFGRIGASVGGLDIFSLTA